MISAVPSYRDLTLKMETLSEGGQGESYVLSRTEGYDYEFVPTLEQKYECPICLLALRAPLQTSCGHRFCKDCIHNTLSLSESHRRCPIDNTPLGESDLFPDCCAEREVLQLKVRCPNSSLGCTQIVDLMYIEHHTQACSYQPVLCPNECSAMVLQRELEQHLSSQCLLRQKLCALCNEPYTCSQEQLHLATCGQVLVGCELCGSEVVRGELPAHMSDSCPKGVVSCPFTEHGCCHKMVRADLDDHLAQSTQYHLHLLSSAQKRITALVWEVSRSAGLAVLGSSPGSLSFSRQPSLRSQLSTSSPTPDRHDGGGGGGLVFPSPPKYGGGAFGGASGGGGVLPFPSPPLKLNTTTDNTTPSKLHIPFSHLAMGLEEEVEGETEGRKGGSGGKGGGGTGGGSISLPPQQEAILRDLCEKRLEVSQGLLQVNIALANLQRQVEGVEGRVERAGGDAEGRFCHGVYVWRLRGFPSLVEELQERPTRVLHSPAFYTSPFGYKFCMRLNLTLMEAGRGGGGGGAPSLGRGGSTNANLIGGRGGEGVGGGGGGGNSLARGGGGGWWLSLFIHGMRGENDTFLDWPFAGTITFAILDCSDAKTKTHISETLQSSPDRQAFSRPQAHRNPKGFGYTEFASLDTVLNGGAGGGVYVVDGTLCIKASVSTGQHQSRHQHSEGSGRAACICQHQQKSGSKV
ncbi:TNF receptor-associated factor 6-like [Eriocheir sinensis]|uniref:TNF receptor-associated factor 6-like n=1 Tax=Eriocheir sinensis TaxID=95602 RepID=UPI0021C5D652|nr:TNF receptor-associated factor 6-like [Eriocheir sinensis]